MTHIFDDFLEATGKNRRVNLKKMKRFGEDSFAKAGITNQLAGNDPGFFGDTARSDDKITTTEAFTETVSARHRVRRGRRTARSGRWPR